MKSRSMLHWIVIMVSIALLSETVWSDHISLRRAVTLDRDATRVRLADIADLSGPNAMAWANLTVAQVALDDEHRMTIGEVRAVLDQAGVHWGRINLHGRDVLIRTGGTRSAESPLAMRSLRIDRANAAEVRPQRATVAADEVPPQATLRRWVTEFLAGTLNVDPTRLKVTFDVSDGPWLDQPRGDARFEIRALSDITFTDRLDLEIRRWTDGRPGERRLIRVKPLIRCTVAEAAMNIARLEPLREHQVNAVQAWLTPSQRKIRLEPTDVIGRVPVTPLREGALFRARDIRAVQVVDRGDQVIVRCLVGGAAISLKAKAESPGGLGETIELRRGRERETFTAVVTGPGEAVIDLSPVASPS